MVLVLMDLVFIACSVFGIISGFVLSCWACMLVIILLRRGGNNLRSNCFLASQPLITGWVFSVAVVAFNLLYFSRGWAVYRKMIFCAFNACRGSIAIVFCVAVLLAPYALWDFFFMSRWLHFYCCVS